MIFYLVLTFPSDAFFSCFSCSYPLLVFLSSLLFVFSVLMFEPPHGPPPFTPLFLLTIGFLPPFSFPFLCLIISPPPPPPPEGNFVEPPLPPISPCLFAVNLFFSQSFRNSLEVFLPLWLFPLRTLLPPDLSPLVFSRTSPRSVTRPFPYVHCLVGGIWPI